MTLESLPKFAAMLLHLAVLLLLLGLGAWFYAPPPHMAGFVYAGNSGDPLGFIWFLNWLPFSAAHHLPFFYTHFAAAPVGTELAWRTSILSLSVPAQGFTARYGALAVYNALMLAAPGLAGWAAYLAVCELTGDALAALAAGLIFAFSGYMLGQMTDHLNLSFSLAVPLCLWAILAAARQGWGTWRLGLMLAGLGIFQFGLCQELFASLVLFGGIGLGVTYALCPEERAVVRRLGPGLALGLALTLAAISPEIWQMLRYYGDAGQYVASPKHYSADLLGFILPTPLYWLGGGLFQPVTQLFPGAYDEQGGYVGLPLLCLLGRICWGRRAEPLYAVPGVVAVIVAVLSLGPYAHVLGREVSTAPWLLGFKLPFLKSMLPLRFLLYMWLALAVLLAVWLAEPGGKTRRYAVLALCLLFLLPARAYDRNWTTLDVPAMLSDGTISMGNEILILPEQQTEAGLQYAAGMRFTLAVQGYPCSYNASPFNKWPLYRTIFMIKYQKYLGLVDPAMLAAFLATYRVQDVVVTGDAAAFADAGSQSAILARLLPAAGWRLMTADADARLYVPVGPQMPPSPAQLAAYMRMPRPENHMRALDYEWYWVRGIRLAARVAGQDPGPWLALYARHAHPLVPVMDMKGAAP